MKTRLFFCLFFLLPFFSIAMNNSTFERGFGTPYDDEGTAICRSQNQFYSVAGYTYGYSSGTNKDIYLVQFNDSGGINFSSHCGTTDDESATGIAEFTNGDLFVIGNTTRSSNSNYSRIVFAKFDLIGQLIWCKQIGDTSKRLEANELIILPSGKVAICGRTISGTQTSALILIVDTSGVIISQHDYSINGNENFIDIILTVDGNLATCSATKSSFGPSIIVYGLDMNGDSIWRYENSVPEDSIDVKAIVQYNNGNYYVCGNYYSAVSYSHIYYYFFDQTRTVSKYNGNNFSWGTVEDMAIGNNFEEAFSACDLFNFSNIIGCQVYDTMTFSPAYWRFMKPNPFLLSGFYPTTRGAKAILVTEDSGNPVVTLVGKTNFSNMGGFDVAIVHTNDGIYTKCNSGSPIISAKGSTALCPRDSVLISRDANFFPYQRWVNFTGSPTDTLNSFGDSLWVYSPGYYALVAMDLDSSIWISDWVKISFADTSNPIVSPSGMQSFCRANGQSLTLSVLNSGLSQYQWYLDSLPIQFATTNSLATTNAGVYFCEALTECGLKSSNVVPVNDTAGPATFIMSDHFHHAYRSWCNYISNYLEVFPSVGASYQWQFDGSPISGDTGLICNILGPGDYSLIITNACGSQTISFYSVAIEILPISTTSCYPCPYKLCGINDSILLTPDNICHVQQWFLNGVPIAGATNNYYYAKQQGNYTYSFDEIFCTQTSILSDIRAISLDTLPTSLVLSIPNTNICDTLPAIVLPTLSGINYNWYWNGMVLPTMGDSLSISSPGNYWVEIHDAACKVYSDTLNITNNTASTGLNSIYISCVGDTLWLDVGSNMLSQIWSNGDTSQITFAYSSIVDTFLYTVQLTDFGMCMGIDSVNVFYDLCNNVSEEGYTYPCSISPTVFTDKLSISNYVLGEFFFSLYSDSGEILETGSLMKGEIVLNTSRYSRGLYFMVIFDKERHQKVLKLVKQ